MLGGGAFLDALETEFRRRAREFYDLSHCIPAKAPRTLSLCMNRVAQPSRRRVAAASRCPRGHPAGRQVNSQAGRTALQWQAWFMATMRDSEMAQASHEPDVRSAAFTPLQHPMSQGFRTGKRRKRRAPIQGCHARMLSGNGPDHFTQLSVSFPWPAWPRL